VRGVVGGQKLCFLPTALKESEDARAHERSREIDKERAREREKETERERERDRERERERERERDMWLEAKRNVLEQKLLFFAHREVIQITSRLGQEDFSDFLPTDVLTGT
jgi:hypothetical protein